MDSTDAEKIVLHFERFCIRQHEAIHAGDTDLSSRYARQIINCCLQLKKLGRIGDLIPLVRSENETVRFWAATNTLPTDTAASIAVLKKIGRGRGMIALSARMSLKEWENGTLDLGYGNHTI